MVLDVFEKLHSLKTKREQDYSDENENESCHFLRIKFRMCLPVLNIPL